MVAPAIIAAGIAAGGSILGGGISGRAASRERRHAEQRMLDMDNTKHQREVKDLRKAGLNPILSATQGAASAGQVPGPAPVPDYSKVAKEGVEAYNAARLVSEQTKLIEAQRENTDANTRKTNLAYLHDKYFAPMERMQGINTGLETYRQQVHTGTGISTQLMQMQQDLISKQLSNQDAKRLLDRKLKDGTFADYVDSAPYAERQKLERLMNGSGSASDVLNLLIEIIRK